MTLQDWFGSLMVIIQLGLLLPLTIKLIRSRSSDGIALSGEAMWVIAGIGWAIYGYASQSMPLLASGVSATMGSMLVLILTGSWLSDKRKKVIKVCILTAGLLIAGIIIGGITGLGVGLAILGIVQFIPQIRISFSYIILRQPTPGVSILAASLRGFYALGWAVFAGAWWLWEQEWYEANWALVVWGVAGGLAYGLQAFASSRGIADPRVRIQGIATPE